YRKPSFITTGNFKQHKLDYHVNEKLGSISTEITDTASDIMEEAGNSIFSSVVVGVIADTFDKTLDNLKVQLVKPNDNVLAKLDEVIASCENINSELDKIETFIGRAAQRSLEASQDLASIEVSFDSASTTFSEMSMPSPPCRPA
ncbi:MAG: hypothetical protein HUJ51_04670, partial [Eggerthellaceae bacterium]|nr:hypothetical protein [Eggerthellaceae bacterium]